MVLATKCDLLSSCQEYMQSFLRCPVISGNKHLMFRVPFPGERFLFLVVIFYYWQSNKSIKK